MCWEPLALLKLIVWVCYMMNTTAMHSIYKFSEPNKRMNFFLVWLVNVFKSIDTWIKVASSNNCLIISIALINIVNDKWRTPSRFLKSVQFWDLSCIFTTKWIKVSKDELLGNYFLFCSYILLHFNLFESKLLNFHLILRFWFVY